MARIEDLAARYQGHISAPWQMNLAGGQKMIFVVYPKVDERRLRARLELFELATNQAGHGWHLFDFTDVFARWMATTSYSEIYFDEPDSLTMKLRSEFMSFAASELRNALEDKTIDANTVVAACGIASLFGFTSWVFVS